MQNSNPKNPAFPSSLGIYLANISEIPLLLACRSGQPVWSNMSFKDVFKDNLRDVLSKTIAASTLGNFDLEFEGKTYLYSIQEIKLSEQEKADFKIKDSELNVYTFKHKEVMKSSINESLNIVLHDLKNPLGAIFGYADSLLENNQGNNFDHRQSSIINRIRSASSRTIEMIKNFQLLSQIEKKPLVTDSTSNLNEITENVITHTFRENPNEPKLNLILDITPAEIKVDKFSLERIIANLYSNALKYTPNNGEITIKTYKEKNMAVFEINNTPAFIPEDEQSTIFEKYKRGSNIKLSSGSGLGLYIIKEIIKSHHACLKLTSTHEQGTTFSISFIVK